MVLVFQMKAGLSPTCSTFSLVSCPCAWECSREWCWVPALIQELWMDFQAPCCDFLAAVAIWGVNEQMADLDATFILGRQTCT